MHKICDDLGKKMAGLTAVSFSLYLLKEGIFTVVGAETAQMHPNSQVFYAFNRGAGKQYGVPWFGNASVYNRRGWKSHGECGEKNSPTKGTSPDIWLVSDMVSDITGLQYNGYSTIAGSEKIKLLAALLAIARHIPIVLDAVCESQDAEYLDVMTLKRILAQL